MLEKLIEYDITKDNFEDDWAIIKAVGSKYVSTDTKQYIVSQYMERINNFDDELTERFLKSLSEELYEKFADYIKMRIETLDDELLANIFYNYKEDDIVDCKNITEFANYLVNQDWFKNNERYSGYVIGYNLTKKNIYYDKEKIDLDEILNYGEFILNMLFDIKCNVNLANMIIKNYIELIKKYNLEFCHSFIERGYKVIDKFIENEIVLTQNMIIFDCYVNSSLYNIKSLDCVNFSKNENWKECGSFHDCFHTLDINISSIDRIHEVFPYKIACLFSFYIFSHELVHADQYDYIRNFKTPSDNLTKLRIYNCLVSLFSSRFSRELYYKEHNCFYREFDANIRGFEILYQKCKLLPQINENDILKFNKFMASDIFTSYYSLKDFDGYDSNIKLSPVQFTRISFNLIKDELSDRSKEELIFTPELKKIESNLTDYEKFILGYDNPYLEILEVVVNKNYGFSVENLIEDIPKTYEQYNMFFDKKYEFLKDDIGKIKIL